MIVILLLSKHDQEVDAASLRIHPNRAQFFVYESLTFYCEGVSYCEVVRESHGNIHISNAVNKRTSTGSSCTIRNVYLPDSGEYWFEAGGGKRSNSVNITVTDGSVILEIPALPVMEGEAVTLTCRNKMTSSKSSADFHKDGVFINNSSTGNMIIHSVSKSDEGLYKCSISGASGDVRPTSGIIAAIILKLLTRGSTVLHQEEPRAHCTSVTVTMRISSRYLTTVRSGCAVSEHRSTLEGIRLSMSHNLDKDIHASRLLEDVLGSHRTLHEGSAGTSDELRTF
ncbi:low affinity immunoglobulin gamma Fc region receptor II-like [Anabas testudineus]|uniref:low affinity immunoglobulin gamma Fc region receptor II-like n=1 Tax=Anabas testudineus TaxID=64144 RepID=UPI00143CE319|nr:low affinity immunoglobulin gamma Fc region receptor II-like [Anabas testudineus]